MNLNDIVRRSPAPLPWQEGDNIPWHDPAFSRRMLAEHLDQSHDKASRRTATIMAQVDWIHDTVLDGRLGRILDLGCGPGLYSNELARREHSCVGIDYSPASIDYAKSNANDEALGVRYHLADIRKADYGSDYDLAMLLFGEFNVFSPDDAATILAKAFAALRPGGTLLLEAHTLDAFSDGDTPARTWFSAESGLFAAGPHLVLLESFWDAATKQGTQRYYVVETANAPHVTAHAQSYQGYEPDEYEQVLAANGFDAVRILPGLAHDRMAVDSNFCAILAQRPNH